MTEPKPNPIIIKKLGGPSGGLQIGVRIPGVLPSVRFREQVVSTGIPSLDSYIGSGIPLRSILLIEESFMCQYADLILKCFLAEGASYNHHLYIASGKTDSKQFIQELPSIKNDASRSVLDQHPGQGSGITIHKKETDDMKIAWRYQHESGRSGGSIIPKGPKPSKFEFRKKSTPEEIGCSPSRLVVSSAIQESKLDLNGGAINPMPLLKEIAHSLKNFETGSSSNFMRIALSHCDEHLLNVNFMMGLKALVRHTNSCAVLTVSFMTLESDLAALKRCEQFCDTVISLQVVLNERRKSELGDIDGLCQVNKLSSMNCLKLVSSTRSLGFTFKRKQLAFQELHLPPEGETTVQREVATSSKKPSSTEPSASPCGTIKGKSIDF